MFYCTKCEFKSSNGRFVFKHMVKEHEPYVKCSFCVYQNSDFKFLWRHERRCKGSKTVYTCERCNVKLTFWHYRRHYRNCSGPGSNQTIQKKTSLKLIIKDASDLICRNCGFIALSKNAMEFHQILKCRQCIVKIRKLKIR